MRLQVLRFQIFFLLLYVSCSFMSISPIRKLTVSSFGGHCAHFTFHVNCWSIFFLAFVMYSKCIVIYVATSCYSAKKSEIWFCERQPLLWNLGGIRWLVPGSESVRGSDVRYKNLLSEGNAKIEDSVTVIHFPKSTNRLFQRKPSFRYSAPKWHYSLIPT